MADRGALTGLFVVIAPGDARDADLRGLCISEGGSTIRVAPIDPVTGLPSETVVVVRPWGSVAQVVAMPFEEWQAGEMLKWAPTSSDDGEEEAE